MIDNEATPKMIDFDRSICRNVTASATREWLVTNGIGGYAAGTVVGILTRRYHGLLIAALKPPLGRTLLATKLDETALYNGQSYPLFANAWQGDVIDPLGFYHLDHFYLDGTTPVWEYTCADALLEKRIWMQQGENTTYVRYHLRRASQPLHLTMKALVNYRDYHSSTHAGNWRMGIDEVPNGLRVTPYDEAATFYLLSDHAQVQPRHEWYRNFALSVEAYRGLDSGEDHLYVGDFTVALQPGESATLVFSTKAIPNLDSASVYAAQQQHEQALLAQAKPFCHKAIEQLVLAAAQFIVTRPQPQVEAPPAAENLKSKIENQKLSTGHSVIAGYPWFGDWGRDTMIALPGLTLTTGRPAIAASILRTFAQFVDQGMLPNRFPDAGETPEYNTADATLWYFEAIRAYHAATGDDALLRDLFPVLQEIIDWHVRGTRYRIHVDPNDGLLYAGEPGVQLTWMDAKVGDWVVTPRMGKAVELNALWYNALCSMADFAKRLRKAATPYTKLAKQAQSGFGRFWASEKGYCYDVIDTPEGNDARLRPNQLFAVSLPYSPLAPEQQKAVVDICAQELLTPHGLHSLAPGEPASVAHYGGNAYQRDSGYHQGTVWGWLIGPFVLAHLRVYQDKALARSYLLPLLRHLSDHGLGSISEIFDAEAPFTPRGCFAQAWSVAEVLRTWVACQ